MINKNGTYKCPVCEVIGTIDDRTISVRVQCSERGTAWPTHRDCEWSKTIDNIDISKLERIS